MPGYGYAAVARAQRRAWRRLILEYLRGRPNLRCVFILVDARRGLREADLDLMNMLDSAAVQYRIILTKTDKVKDQDLQQRTQHIAEALKTRPAAFPGVLPTSAHNRAGLAQLRAVIAACAGGGQIVD